MPLIRDYPSTQVLEPTDAFVIDRLGVGTLALEGLAISGGGARCITYVFDGGGSALTTSMQGDLYLPFDCTLTGCVMLADQAGTLDADILMAALADYPPTSGNTIIPEGYATLTDEDHAAQDISAWTTGLVGGDTLRFVIHSTDDTIERLTIALTVQ